MEFKDRLKEIRLEKKISQKQLGEVLHVSKMCISHWEKGNSEPSIFQLKSMANFFTVSIDFLTGYKDF